MKRLFVIVVFALFSSASVTLAQTVVEQCGCSGLLGGGVFDTVRSETNRDAEEYERQFVAFSSYEEFRKAADNGVAGSYFGSYGKFGFDANWSREDFAKHQSNLIREFNLQKKVDFRETIFREYASNVIVDGYNKCIETCVGIQGFRSWFTAQDRKNLTLTIFNGVQGEPISVRDFSISDGGILKTPKPKKLNAGNNVFRIERVGSKPISLVVRVSSGGDFSAYTPAYRLPPSPLAQFTVNTPVRGLTVTGQAVLVDFDPIVLADGKRVKTIALSLIDLDAHKTIRTEQLEPQARTANFQLHYVVTQSERGNGIVHIPSAQFIINITLEAGGSVEARSGVFTIDRR